MRSVDELRDAHDVLAEVYANRLANTLAEIPADRAVLDLWSELVKSSAGGRADDRVGEDRVRDDRVGDARAGDGHGGDSRAVVADIGCGTGRLSTYLAERGLRVRGLDLSPEMVRVARRDFPGHEFAVGDVRDLPYADASLDGLVAWYSLMYLHPEERAQAFAEMARVVRPGGLLTAAYKLGDDQLRRAGRTLNLGIEFDIYWWSPAEMTRQLEAAGFAVEFSAQRAAEPDEPQPQRYVIARRA